MKAYYQDQDVLIWHGDAREVLPTITTAALVCTDPPYNVGKAYDTHNDSMPDSEYESFMRDVLRECQRIAPKQAWIAPRYKMPLFTQLMPAAHMVVVRRRAAGPYRGGWSDQFETTLVIGKPNRMVPDLWDDIRLKGEGYFFREETYGHPGYTPEPLMTRLISLLSEPGETVVDPFCGTGTSARAAKNLGRKFIGIEESERYCQIAADRMAQTVMPLLAQEAP